MRPGAVPMATIQGQDGQGKNGVMRPDNEQGQVVTQEVNPFRPVVIRAHQDQGGMRPDHAPVVVSYCHAVGRGSPWQLLDTGGAQRMGMLHEEARDTQPVQFHPWHATHTSPMILCFTHRYGLLGAFLDASRTYSTLPRQEIE